MGHLRDNGFEVDLREVDDIAALQAEHGVPEDLRGCHSAMIGDHMVEGHVPADLIKRYLEEDAGHAGISVPGMVAGPPGMEGSQPVPFEVLVFDEDGNKSVYAKRPGGVRGGSH